MCSLHLYPITDLCVLYVCVFPHRALTNRPISTNKVTMNFLSTIITAVILFEIERLGN